MQLGKIIQLQNVIGRLSTEQLPFRTSYKIMKLTDYIIENEKFYHREMEKLAEIYGEKNPDGQFVKDDYGNILIKQDFLSECQEKVSELMKTEIEDPNVYFNFEELENLNFSPTEVNALDPFIQM